MDFVHVDGANNDEQRPPVGAGVSGAAIKDTEARGKAVPMLIRRGRLDGAWGVDPLCAYDALRGVGVAGAAQTASRAHGGAAERGALLYR
eukprot:714150-Pleurochrysis_carterae.AAC.2